MNREKVILLRMSLYIEYAAPLFIKVKAYNRFRNGKNERVRAYYRRVCGRRG